jgi:hypothetical protein
MNRLSEQTGARRLVMVAMLVGLIMGWAAGDILRPDPAAADEPSVLPNSAAQRYDMVVELQSANAKLASIEAFLKSGKLKVIAKEEGK